MPSLQQRVVAEKSMPGTTLTRMPKATCSVSAKKLSGFRFSTIRPTCAAPAPSPRGSAWWGRAGRSRRRRLPCPAVIICTPSSHSGNVAGLDGLPQVAAMEVGVGLPAILTAPRPRPRPVNACELRLPVELARSALSPARVDRSRKVWTPKPSIMRRLRGMARSDMAHISMCVDLGHQRREVPEGVVRTRGLGHARCSARA